MFTDGAAFMKVNVLTQEAERLEALRQRLEALRQYDILDTLAEDKMTISRH